MASQSNLALALKPEEALESQAANAISFAKPLRPGSVPATEKSRQVTVRGKHRLTPLSFKDNYSGDFRPFRIY